MNPELRNSRSSCWAVGLYLALPIGMEHIIRSTRAFSIKSGILAILVVANFFVSVASAADPLERPDRPTMSEVLAVAHEIEAMPAIRGAQVDPRVQKILAEGPRMIAELEYAYPGATWAPLGRDSAFLADVIEAYYLARGEKNRVIRLNASGNSFKNGQWEFEFLKSSGLALDADGRPVHPFVILDATSWKGTLDKAESQSRRLVGSVYAQTPENLRVTLLNRLNAIGQGPTSGGSLNGMQISSAIDLGNFFGRLELGAAGPAQILYITDAFAYGHWDWHGPFEPFERQADGRVVAAPGALSPASMRAGVFKSMLEVALIVRSQDFQNRTIQAAQELGFALDWQSKHRVLVHDKLFEQWKTDKEWTLAQLKSVEAVTEGMPKGFASRFSERWWELAQIGIESGAIHPDEFEKLAERIAARASSDPSLTANLGWQFSQKRLTARLAEFKDVLFSPRQERLSEARSLFLAEVSESWSGLVSPAILQKCTFSFMTLVKKKNIYHLDPKARVAAMTALLPFAKKPQDFLDLVAYDARNAPSAVNRVMDVFIAQNLKRFNDLGASPAQMIHLQATKMWERSARMTVQAAAFGGVKDFAELLSLGAAAGDGVVDPSFAKAVLRLGKDGTAAGLKMLVQKVMMDNADKEKILRFAFSRAVTPAEFLLIASYDAANAPSEVNRYMDRLIVEFFPHLLKIGGTIEDILNVENHFLYENSAKQRIHDAAIKHVTDVNARLRLLRGFTAQAISMSAIAMFVSDSDRVSTGELKQLSFRSMVPIEGRGQLRARALQRASTVEEFLEIASYDVAGCPSNENKIMDEILMASMARLVSLGADISTLMFVENKLIYEKTAKGQTLDFIMANVKSIDEAFLVVSQADVKLNAKPVRQMFGKFQIPTPTLRKIVDSSLVPTEEKIRLLERALMAAHDKDEALEILKYDVSGAPVDFNHAMDRMISSNLKRFVELGATPEDIENLRDNYIYGYGSNAKRFMNQAIERAEKTGSLLPPETGLRRAWSYMKGFFGGGQSGTSAARPATTPSATGETPKTQAETAIRECPAALMKNK